MKIESKTVSEIIDEENKRREELQKNPVWGPWRLNYDDLTIEHTNGYWIDVERLNTSAQMLDWIFQVAAKAWADKETVHQLIKLFDYVFHPQANYCSWGTNKRANGRALAVAFFSQRAF